MMEIITILVCFIKKYIIGWANNRNLAKLPPLPEETYHPPVNPEIQNLSNKKLEIESTIEEFNTPSTFAKYSKMQRQLIKLDKQIQELTAKLEEENKVSKVEWQIKREHDKKEREAQRSSYMKRSMVIRFLVNMALIRMVHTYYSYPLPYANEWPFSMFVNEAGELKCSYLMIAGNLLFQF